MDISKLRDASIDELEYISKNIDKISNNTGLSFFDLMEKMNDNPEINFYNLLKEDSNE